MADGRLIYRCLGVPDMLTEDSGPKAAARRLAEAAGLDVSLDPNVFHQSQLRLADAASVIARASELVASGELDGFIGNFGHQDDAWYTSLITRRIDLHVYEQGQRCAQALLESLRNYITSHPFEDDSGRPFM